MTPLPVSVAHLNAVTTSAWSVARTTHAGRRRRDGTWRLRPQSGPEPSRRRPQRPVVDVPALRGQPAAFRLSRHSVPDLCRLRICVDELAASGAVQDSVGAAAGSGFTVVPFARWRPAADGLAHDDVGPVTVQVVSERACRNVRLLRPRISTHSELDRDGSSMRRLRRRAGSVARYCGPIRLESGSRSLGSAPA